MNYLGRVKNGVIVLEDGIVPPEGEAVEAMVLPKDQKARTWGEVFRPIIGKAKGARPAAPGVRDCGPLAQLDLKRKRLSDEPLYRAKPPGHSADGRTAADHDDLLYGK